jgi:elongation factor G
VLYTEDDLVGSTYQIAVLDDDQRALAEEAYAELLEAVADSDEKVGEMFLMEEPISVADLKAGLRRATIKNALVPIAGGSAFKNKGVQFLLDAVVDYLPSPLDVPAAEGHSIKDESQSVSVETSDSEKFCALAFKLWSDKYFGKLVFFRVYSGTLSKGDMIYNPRTNQKERVGRLIQVQADKHEEIETCFAGDIAALVGPKNIQTGDTLSHQQAGILLEPPLFPEPVISMAVEPRTKADSDKMSVGLDRLSDEDPTFVVRQDEETGQTIIAGMGELHLEVIIDRLKREFNVQANVGKPQIAYRETITTPAKGDGKFIRDAALGGKAMYGHVIVSVSPNERGMGIEIDHSVSASDIPKEYLPAIISGIEDATTNGQVAGFPVVDLKVNVCGGSFHEVDSNDNAFKIAAIFAMKEAFKEAGAILLEPVMNVEIATPDEFQGDIMGDLNRRRGQIQEIETKGPIANVSAIVPLAEMFGYSTDVRTLSSGRASYTMEPSSFEEVPRNIVDQLIAERGGGY